MKILQVNSHFSVGAPPRIVKGIYDTLLENGDDCLLAASRKSPFEGMNTIRIGNKLTIYRCVLMSRLLDMEGFSARRATHKLVQQIKAYDPDIIHLHNLHGYYINIEILFKYLAEADKPVVWTLHDCWTFTGHCTYFDYIGCKKWITHCEVCPNRFKYPKSLFLDRSYKNYEQKRRLFTSVKNMFIVTPSHWLAGLVRQSFLKLYPVQVIHNGINLSVFRPTPSDFRKRYGLEEKIIILAVASIWDKRKGYNDLIALSKLLNRDQQLIIVGLSRKQYRTLPNKVIGILRTNNTKELAEIYTAADVLVNPTYEDNYPTVNIESIACGTPVISYDTGGIPEQIHLNCGTITRNKTADSIFHEVITIGKKSDNIRKLGYCFENNEARINELFLYKLYLKLYDLIINNSNLVLGEIIENSTF